MKKIALSAALLLLGCLTVPAQTLSTERSQELELLRGIDAARVEVKSEIKQRGAQAAALQEAVEAKLKRSGIKVLEPDESCRVIVFVSLTRSNNNSIVIRVQLQQIATLNRLDKIIFAPTWERLMVARLGQQNIFLGVSRLVDQLIADYDSVNPQVSRLSPPGGISAAADCCPLAGAPAHARRLDIPAELKARCRFIAQAAHARRLDIPSQGA